MKKQLPDSFYANRITEAIRSLAVYAKQAQAIADEIRPVVTADPKVRAAGALARPVLTSVAFGFKGEVTPEVLSELKKKFPLEVSGTNLKQVETFRLIPSCDLADDRFVAKESRAQSFDLREDSFTVELDLSNARAGSYHAWVRNTKDQEALMQHAFDLEAPTITTPPLGQEVSVNGNARFNVVATGTEPLSYQWKKQGRIIAGATEGTLVLDRVQMGQAGDYVVEVSNVVGRVLSETAKLKVTCAPKITSQTPPARGIVGMAYSFPVTATGTPPPTFTATQLPTGLTLDPTTGVISGTPAAAGTFNVTITATNGHGPVAQQNYELTVK